MGEADTFPKLLRKNNEKYGDTKIAMLDKDLGVWQRYTWRDYYENVKYFYLGLMSLGFEAGDKLAILGETKPEMYWAELAAQVGRGAAVGIFTDCLPEEVKYFVEHSHSKFLIAYDQEQVDKGLKIKDELPLLRKIIYCDPKGLWDYDDPLLISFDQVLSLGERYEKSHPDLFEKNIESGDAKENCVYCYTSGTTGLPKGAMISHQALIGNARAWGSVEGFKDKEVYLSFLPIAWVAEQVMAAGTLVYGQTIAFCEDTGTVQENIREISPSILFWGARNWEDTSRQILAKMGDSTMLNRLLYHLMLPIGYKITEFEASGETPDWFWRFLRQLAYWLFFRELKDKIGMLKTKYALHGGGVISPDTFRYFRAIGVNLKSGYGATEYPFVTLPIDKVEWGVAGVPVFATEVRISNEGEVLFRGPYLFSGYYKNPERTKESLKDGWYHSQDFASIKEDGGLVPMGRLEDLKTLKDGFRYPPEYIESRLRFVPYIRDALVVGDENSDFISALVDIDLGNVSRWAEARHIEYTTHADLSQKPPVLELISSEIKKVNALMPGKMKITMFANLHKEFDPDEAELTRTRKLKRAFLENRYRAIIDAFNTGQETVTVEASITYRDGRKGTTKTDIKIITVSR